MMSDGSAALSTPEGAAVFAADVKFTAGVDIEILAGIDLTVRAGEFVSIVGPSGCGKTTFLNMIAGLQSYSSGRLTVMGEAPAAGRNGTAYALARDALLPWRDALGNVELALQVRGVPKQERQERAAALLSSLGLGDALHRHPAELSQGMRQRVALARTLVTEPKLLVLDEPFAALDAQTRIQMQQLLLRLLAKFSGTMMLVTHDLAEAITLSDKVVVFSKRPARVKSVHDIDMGARHRSADAIRSDVRFGPLFDQIWKNIELGYDHP